jgi:hypothetical protein
MNMHRCQLYAQHHKSKHTPEKLQLHERRGLTYVLSHDRAIIHGARIGNRVYWAL